MTYDRTHEQTVLLRFDRCRSCGRWYGYEPVAAAACPLCVSRWLDERQETIDGLRGTIVRLGRTNAGLRGALKRQGS